VVVGEGNGEQQKWEGLKDRRKKRTVPDETLARVFPKTNLS
jgi:hypothetical protein